MRAAMIRPDGSYFELVGKDITKAQARHAETGAREVPLRPTPLHRFDGTRWQPPTQEEATTAWRERAFVWAPDAIEGFAIEGWITHAEAEAWLAGGALPAIVRTVLAGLSERERTNAVKRLMPGNRWRRLDPLVSPIVASAMPDADQATREATTDAFFQKYAPSSNDPAIG